MPWTTPGTATAGSVLTASFWNEQVRDNTQQLRDDRALVLVKTQSYSAASAVTVTNAFNATYNGYIIVLKGHTGSTGSALGAQMRSGSTTETSANYAQQQCQFSNTTFTGTRTSGQTSWSLFAAQTNLNTSAQFTRIEGPSASTRTSFASMFQQSGGASVDIYLSGGDLATTTSYDQIVLTPSAGTITGTISIYGIL